ncbi:hypothetical protein FHG87_023796 [Trinorchestia longiramus]|nr:hypothetical protein FHG87_023796 [Trinorchestia longiramus]
MRGHGSVHAAPPLTVPDWSTSSAAPGRRNSALSAMASRESRLNANSTPTTLFSHANQPCLLNKTLPGHSVPILQHQATQRPHAATAGHTTSPYCHSRLNVVPCCHSRSHNVLILPQQAKRRSMLPQQFTQRPHTASAGHTTSPYCLSSFCNVPYCFSSSYDVSCYLSSSRDVPCYLSSSRDVPCYLNSSRDVPCYLSCSRDVPCYLSCSRDVPCYLSCSRDVPCYLSCSRDVPCYLSCSRDGPYCFSSLCDLYIIQFSVPESGMQCICRAFLSVSWHLMPKSSLELVKKATRIMHCATQFLTIILGSSTPPGQVLQHHYAG